MANVMSGSLNEKPGKQRISIKQVQRTLKALGATNQKIEVYNPAKHAAQGLDYIKFLII